MKSSAETGDIISSEIIYLPIANDEKERILEKGNLVELAENIAEGIGSMAGKFHDLFLGSNTNEKNKNIDSIESSQHKPNTNEISSYHKTDDDLIYVTKFP